MYRAVQAAVGAAPSKYAENGSGSDCRTRTAAEQPDGLARAPKHLIDANREMACCFLRLESLNGSAFERLNRYEAALWRQTVQTLFALQPAKQRSPSTRTPPGDLGQGGRQCVDTQADWRPPKFSIGPTGHSDTERQYPHVAGRPFAIAAGMSDFHLLPTAAEDRWLPFMNGQSSSPDSAERCYVIGDIHGRLDLLDSMIDLIGRDVGHGEADRCLTVTLGDYVDRGLNSRGVLDRLASNPFPTAYVALKGNHELMLEQFLEDPKTAENWRRFGGLETLDSYGVPINEVMIGKGFDRAGEMLHALIPHNHLAFLSSLRASMNLGNYFLCHAGVRPGVPLDRQKVEDLLWIRDGFLDSGVDFGKIIIHGHTPREWPEDLPNRINVDTGAYCTGRLTCVVLDDEGYRFLFTR